MTGSMSKSKILEISKSGVCNTQIDHLQDYAKFSNEDNLFRMSAGETEYHLYAYISNLFNNITILDVGTRNGNSAIALSENSNNMVISYDIHRTDAHDNIHKKNIEFRIAEFTEDDIDLSDIPLIMIDVDPHDGSQERRMFNRLKEMGWEGIVILDDTRQDMWPEIYKFIQELPYVVHDVTDIGHFSGTAIVEFGSKYKIRIVD